MAATRTNRSLAAAPSPLHSRRMVVIGATLAAMLLAAAAVWGALGAMPHLSQALPVRQVVFVSATGAPLTEIGNDSLKRVADALQTRGALMLQLDLIALKDNMKQMAWVREASVRRQFPSTVRVAIEEHRPVAAWNMPTAAAEDVDNNPHSLLVNSYGEVFRAVISDEQKALLPQLGGPEGAAAEVLEKYAAMLAPLQSIGRAPARLLLSARRAWQVTLDNGSILQLGRGDSDARLARFIQTYPRLAALQAANVNVDLRYQNGFTIGGGEAPGEASRKNNAGIST